jgi:hypothetical protein
MKKIMLILIVIAYSQTNFSQSKLGLGLSFEPGFSGISNIEMDTGNPNEQYFFESRFSYSFKFPTSELSNK